MFIYSNMLFDSKTISREQFKKIYIYIISQMFGIKKKHGIKIDM